MITIERFYEKIGGNYNDVLKRFGSEMILKRFVLKFLQDPSFSELRKGFEEKDAETVFRAAHTLKGVCANLGFERLYRASYELTESFRSKSFTDNSFELYRVAENEYRLLISAIAETEGCIAEKSSRRA